MASSGSNTITTVPAGAICTVTETTVPAAPVNYAYGTTPAPVMLTTTVAGPNNANFTNVLTRQTGSLTVAKDVAGPGSSASLVNGSFPFSVNCGADGTFTGSVTITAGATNSTSIPSVPAGASCTVTETGMAAAPAGFSWNAASYTGNPATIPPNAAATVTMHNTLSALAPGSISVTKAIVGGPVPAGTFSITVACPANGGVLAYSSTKTVTGGNSVVFTGVPSPNTSDCSVTESSTLPTPPINYTWNAANTPPAPLTTVSVGDSVVVTNTLVRQISTITIHKTITGGPAGGTAATFGYTTTCDAGGPFTTNVTTVASSGSNTIATVPAGATCTVTDSTVPAPPTGYSWGAIPAAVSLTTTVAGPNTASFTNTLSQQTSTITVNKTVTGGPAGGVSGAFNFSANCGTVGTFSGTIILTSASFGTGTIGVPSGATCTVSETSVPGAPTNYAWGATPPVVVLTTTTAGPNTANFTNPLNTTIVPATIPVPMLRGWVLLMLGAMLLLMGGVYAQQRRSKD